MYYADDIVEQVRSSVDIVDVIGSYVRLKRKGNSYFGLCPFHNEKTGSFSVSGQKQMYYCFGCGAGGNVFTFLMEYENASFTEALKMLADRAGICRRKTAAPRNGAGPTNEIPCLKLKKKRRNIITHICGARKARRRCSI